MTLAAASGASAPHPESDIVEWIGPDGTVSLFIDHGTNTLCIFSEPEPSPVDWAKACTVASFLNIRDIGEPVLVRGVETWTVRFELRPPPGAPDKPVRGSYFF